MKVMAHIDKAHSASTKINPSSTPKSGNLKWINNDCKCNSQSWEIQNGCLTFPGSLINLIFSFNGVKPFLAARLMFSQWRKKMFNMCLPLRYIFYNLQWSRHPLHWTNHASLNKGFTNFLKLSLSLSSSVIRQGQKNRN